MKHVLDLRIAAALALAGVLLGASAPARAQDRGEQDMGREEAAAPEAGGEPADAEEDADADVEVRKEGDKTVTVIRFSGLDISGELKSPQLLYFLTRLRAEFDRPKLPHRSFMPELVRSSRGEEF